MSGEMRAGHLTNADRKPAVFKLAIESDRTPTAAHGYWRWSLLLTLCLVLPIVSGTLGAATPDVRVLIDVSGSMKQNDPHNLRVPALQLMTELLPEGVNAGVWLFAEKPEVLARPGKVDTAWKNQTRARLDRIHSHGMLTNIEQAIAAATADWEQPVEAGERHLVLLTDGLVDVSKDASQSAASRERILSAQLERLRTLQVRVHGIALSDEVDVELMRLLTGQTDGWLESARDADALQRIFLHMMEQTAPPTTVPLQGNHFDIDERVSEFTVLAFTGGTGATTLISPAGAAMSASQPTEGVVWRSEAGYDLVTLTHPAPGQWQLQGVPDPDNRVVVVTDLGIELGPLPSAPPYGETLPIETWLTDHNQPVTRRDLLQLLTATATLTPVPAGAHESSETPASPEPPPDSAAQPLTLPLELDPETARYRAAFDTRTLAPGVYRLETVLDGGTFQRQRTQRLKVTGTPVTIRYDRQQPSDTTPDAALIATLDADADLIETSSLSGYLLLHAPDGRDSALAINKPSTLPLTLTIPIAQPGAYRVQGRLLARTAGGETVEIEPEPQQFRFDFAPAPAAQPPDSSAAPLSWLALAVYVLAGNAILGLLLGLTWWLLERQRKRLAAASIKHTMRKPV